MKRSGKRKNINYYDPVVKKKEPIINTKSKILSKQRPDFGPSQVKDQWKVHTSSIVVLVNEVVDGYTQLVRIIYTSLNDFVAEEFLSDGSARRIHQGTWDDYSVNPYCYSVGEERWNKFNWISFPTECEVKDLQTSETTWMSKKLGVGQFINRAVEDIPQTVFVSDICGLGIRQLDLG